MAIHGLGIIARKFTSKKRFAEYFVGVNAIIAGIAMFYGFFLIPYYRSAGTIEKYLIRLVIHPVIFSFCEMVWRLCLVRFGTEDDNNAHYSAFLIKLSNAINGRLFIVSLTSLGEAAIFLSISLISDLAFKSVYRLRERCANWIVFKITRGKFSINPQLYHRNLTILANMYLIEAFCELTIVLISPFLIWSYSKNRLQFDFIYGLGQDVNLDYFISNAAMNLGFEVVTQFGGLILLILQGIPILSTVHWKVWFSQDTYTRVIMLLCSFTIFIYIYRTWPLFIVCRSNNGCECNFPQHAQICATLNNS